MTKKRNTKSALISSVLALTLGFTSFVGTTFAWFTDSVTSSNNIIASGNLDVELYYQNDEISNWTKVDANTNVFKANTLWEPGHTEVVKLKVVNEGSLALKYNLGVNVASETGSVNVYEQDFLLSKFIKFAVLDGTSTYTREQAVEAAEQKGATALETAYNSGVTALEAKNDTDSDETTVTMVVYMPMSVGNNVNAKKDAAVPTINLGLNLFATQYTAENDSFGNQYDKDAIIVSTADEAQAALDSVEAGAMIKLAPGVNYGTLKLRPVEGNANTTSDIDYSVYKKELLRKVENLTIIGAPDATIDNIEIVTGNQGAWWYVDITNLVIDSVEFTANTPLYPSRAYSSPIFVSLGSTRIDGLTVKNCVLDGGNNKQNFVYFNDLQGTNFETYVKNVTITGNTVSNVERLCELRETENVTITNNTIKNTAQHGILLSCNSGKTYSGNVTITDNKADGTNNRFVRMAGAGASNVVIKDNTISNYRGKDSDFIKVTDSTATPTIENNTISYGSTESVQEAINAGQKNIVLAEGNYALPASSDVTFVGAGKDTVIDLDGTIGNVNISNATVTGANSITVKAGQTAVFENVVFDAKLGGAASGQYGSASGKVVFEGCTFEKMLHFDTTHGAEIVIENCTFGAMGTFKMGAGATSIVVKNCTFDITTSTSIWGEKGIVIYCPTTFTDCEFNNRNVVVSPAGLEVTFNSCTMNGGTPVYYVDNTDGIIRGGNIPNVTIN